MKIFKKNIICLFVLFLVTNISCKSIENKTEKTFSDNIDFACENINNYSLWKKNNFSFLTQDADCYKNYLFSYDNDTSLNIIDIRNNNIIANRIIMEGNVHPHCNSVSFSNIFFNNDDFFPLIYVNAYNTSNLPLATFYAIRVTKNTNENYSQQIVQTISISFINDITLWPSSNENSPYGNFLIDHDKNIIYCYVPDQRINKTRIYEFNVPKLDEKKVNLATNDIIDYFEVPLIKYIQGGYLLNNKLVTSSGFESTSSIPGKISIINVENKEIENEVFLSNFGLKGEPESVFSYDNKLYIGTISGEVIYL